MRSRTTLASICVLALHGGCTGTNPSGPDATEDARPSTDRGSARDGGVTADLGFAEIGVDGFSPDADAGPSCSPGRATGTLPATNGIDVAVRVTDVKHALSPVLQGANINEWFGNANGLWNAKADAPNADAMAKTKRAGLGLLRFPGGTCANLFDWKRSVGPRAKRSCQTDAGDTPVARVEQEYGPSEFIRLVRAAGAAPQIMVPFANESPADAADWVEYMNAPAGTNPNGGVAWADVRKGDGSEAPYDVRRWEIGNEHDRGGHQAYWLSRTSDSARLDQYIAGAELTFTDQPMGRACDFTQTSTTSAAGQTFHLLYGLIKEGTFPQVKIGGVLWKRVADLSAAGPSEQVYALDRGSGAITFGDGAHGAIPAAGQQVTATYTFKHEGFVAMYDAMKAVATATGTPISVCATWAPPATRGTPLATLGEPSFAAEMKRRGLGKRYDCVSMHPYTNFGRDFGDAWSSPEEAHHEHMLGDGWARTMVARLCDDLAAQGSSAYVAISELGALWFGGDGGGDAMPASSSTMTHALYMASQWIHFARLDLGWVEGNTLVANPNGLRGTLGGSATGFVYGAEALTREALKPFFATGSKWVGSNVGNQEQVSAPGNETYPALVVGAALGADRALRIAVVNRRMRDAQRARVTPGGFDHGAEVEVTTVTGASFASYNDDVPGGGDDSVKIARTTRNVSTADFEHTFPAASVTVLTLRPPCP